MDRHGVGRVGSRGFYFSLARHGRMVCGADFGLLYLLALEAHEKIRSEPAPMGPSRPGAHPPVLWSFLHPPLSLRPRHLQIPDPHPPHRLRHLADFSYRGNL